MRFSKTTIFLTKTSRIICFFSKDGITFLFRYGHHSWVSLSFLLNLRHYFGHIFSPEKSRMIWGGTWPQGGRFEPIVIELSDIGPLINGRK